MNPHKPAQNFVLCPRCRSNISVLSSDGLDKIVIEIYRAPPQPALPGSVNRQAITQELHGLVRPLAALRLGFAAKQWQQKQMWIMAEETLRVLRGHGWDMEQASLTLGIKEKALKQRLYQYKLKGWIQKRGKRWVRTMAIQAKTP